MSIQAIQTNPQAVSFGENEQPKKKSKSGGRFVLGAAGGALVGGLAVGEKINTGEKIKGLDDDKFVKKFEGVKSENEDVFNKLKTAREKLGKVGEKVDASLKADYGDVKEVSVEDYLKKEKINAADLTKEKIDELDGKTKGLEDAVNKEKGILEKMTAEEKELKGAAQELEIDKAQKKLDLHKAELEIKKNHKTLIDKAIEKTEEGATEKKKFIKLEEIKTKKIAEEEAPLMKKMTNALEEFKGKLPKKASKRMAIIGAIIGGILLTILASSKKKKDKPQTVA